MYHIKKGFFIERANAHGDVRIVKTTDGQKPNKNNIMFTDVITADIWCSAVCQITSKGEVGVRWHEMRDFHTDPEIEKLKAEPINELALQGIAASRDEGRKLGLLTYYGPTPCRHGHFPCERYVASGGCKECTNEKSLKRYYEKIKDPEWREAKNESYRKHNLTPEQIQRNRRSGRNWKQENRGAATAIFVKRHAAKLDRTPEWVDETEIKKVYLERDLLTEKTGVKHNVDHQVPLRGDVVSGLHVSWNLEAIPEGPNKVKGNSFNPDDLAQNVDLTAEYYTKGWIAPKS